MPRIKRLAMDPSYSMLRQQSDAVKEESDCCVMALALLGNITYADAHAILKARGRKDREGMLHGDGHVIGALRALGFTVRMINPHHFINQYPAAHRSLKSITTHHPRRFPGVFNGNFFLDTSEHVAAIINGKVVDWSVNKSLRVNDIYSVTKEN